MSKHDLTLGSNIERVELPTKEEFKQKFLSRRRPVIITGAMKNWNAISSWNADYFIELFGDKQVDVSVSQNRIFTGDLEKGFTNLRQKIKFNEFITKLVDKNELIDNFYYLQQQSIAEIFPEILQDVEFPIYFDKRLFIDPTIWIGSGGNISPLHYDTMDNLFAQVSGCKHFILFDPKQTTTLYPFPAHSQISHMSQINIDDPDLEKFSKFKKARYLEGVIEKGEILFIPVFWWHHVRTLPSKNQELSISVNFWSKPPVSQFLTPSGLRLAAKIPNMLKMAFN